MNSNTLTDGEMLKMLGGDGGAQVDLVFYLISNRETPLPPNRSPHPKICVPD